MLALKDSFNFITVLNDVEDFKEQTVSRLHADKVMPLAKQFDIKCMYFDSGILLIDSYSYEHRQPQFLGFVTAINNTGIYITSYSVVPDDKLRLLISSKLDFDTERKPEIELHESILMYNRVMEQAERLGCQDVYIKCSRSRNLSFVQFKKNGDLVDETMSLRDYHFGMSVCRCIYNGGKSAGETRGSFDEVSLQEKQIQHTVYDFSGAIKSRLQIRFTKIKTTRIGEITCNMRIQRQAFRLHELGLDEATYRLLKEKISNAKGGIITSGRTGSGKSTTMFAAFLERPKSEKLFTFEDPVEIEAPEEFTNICQITMEENVDDQMKAINRMHPDAVFVQEMRDTKSATFAFNLMISGIPVLTTTHATSAPGVIERLIELGVPLYNIVSDKAVSLIMSQALVKLVCPDCAHTMKDIEANEPLMYSILHDKATKLGVQLSDDMPIRNHNGCSHCKHTGTISRKLVIEHIDLSDDDKSFIERRAFTEWRNYLKTTEYNPIENQCFALAKNGQMCTQEMLEYF